MTKTICQTPMCEQKSLAYLSRDVPRPVWLCGECASALLEVVNPTSFETTDKVTLDTEYEDRKKRNKKKEANKR